MFAEKGGRIARLRAGRDEVVVDVATQALMVRMEARGYWTAFECGGWFKSMFAPTGDALGRLVNDALEMLSRTVVSSPEEAKAYLCALAGLARVVGQLSERTSGQAARGIYMPRRLYPSALDLMRGLRRKAAHLRPSGMDFRERSSFERHLADHLREIDRAFASFENAMGNDYLRACSAEVGIGQYPTGEETYRELVYQNTTLAHAPEEIHRMGLEEVQVIFARMKELSVSEGFAGDVTAYRASLDADPRWRATSVAEIEALFQHYIGRVRKAARSFFHGEDLPRAGYDAAPLPSHLEGTMPYGYYDQPRPGRWKGAYLFNASNLLRRSLIDVAAFTYHELVPGHHVHFASQLENRDLHPLQKATFCNGFNEGWAEYGRRLAEDAGLYKDPAEVFGGLLNDMRQATRLVVDTGMNVFGWSADRARDYLVKYSLIPVAEVDALINWYACEIPAQSLSYSLCRSEMLRLRDEARDRLGSRFDIRDFHHAALSSGGRPLAAVKDDVKRRLS